MRPPLTKQRNSRSIAMSSHARAARCCSHRAVCSSASVMSCQIRRLRSSSAIACSAPSPRATSTRSASVPARIRCASRAFSDRSGALLLARSARRRAAYSPASARCVVGASLALRQLVLTKAPRGVATRPSASCSRACSGASASRDSAGTSNAVASPPASVCRSNATKEATKARASAWLRGTSSVKNVSSGASSGSQASRLMSSTPL
mmetsp:Transcript_6453/g.21580  ORF Transcript_6453/g.21580 Transcript_6453/m.21580 type:complete len:207 (+) Transcript_6453:1260-1880(+)